MMTKENTMNAVRLSDGVLELLAGVCEERRFRAGEKVTVAGEHHHSMFFLLSGWVDIRFNEEGGGGPGVRVGERSALGEMGFLSGKKAVASAVAVSAVTALEVDEAAMAKLAAANPEAAREFREYLHDTVDKRLQ